MDHIIDILEDLRPGIDYTIQHQLVDSRILNSLTILALIAELEDAFDVTIPAVEIIAGRVSICGVSRAIAEDLSAPNRCEA